MLIGRSVRHANPDTRRAIMKFRSQIYTAVSGSVGGVTYARNRGGMYARARSVPVNPNSALQQIVRQRFALIAGFWSLISEAQRELWTNYAEGTPMTDQFGEVKILSGQQMQTRLNVHQRNVGLSGNFTAPPTPGMSLLNPVELDLTGAAWNVTFTDTDSWAIADGGKLQVQIGRQQNPGIEFFDGPWRTGLVIDGATAGAPSSPQLMTNPFGETPIAGQKVSIRVIASDADGRMSMAQKTRTIVTV